MSQKIFRLCIVVTLLLSGCVSLPVPPVKDNMGAVAVEVDLRLKGDLLNLFPGFISPNTIFFARLDESGETYNQNELYKSNYLIGDTAYLLNAKPGTYVAVGFRGIKENTEKNIYKKDAYILFDVLIPEKMINLTQTKVCSGKLSHMGEYHMVEPEFSERANAVDRAQQHYYGKMLLVAYGDVYGKDYFKDKSFDLRGRAAVYSKSNPTFGAQLERFERSEASLKSYIKNASRKTKGTKWETVFRNSLSNQGCR